MVLTYRYRIKDANRRHLQRQAWAVNQVWNYCGETQNAARRHNKRWPSGFDLIKLTLGSSKLLGLHSGTVQAVCKQFVISRDSCGKRPRWRGRRALGWIPFQAARAIRLDGDAMIFLGRRYRIWLSRPVEGRILCGCFAEDARGRWYLNVHELSTRLVRQNRRICIGNLNAGGLARTSLAKSVLDAGWSQLRSQLHYKAIRHGVEYLEVDERLTTQVCSACGARGGPQGREDLVVRVDLWRLWCLA
jgi:IS605 OrfB family transposase